MTYQDMTDEQLLKKCEEEFGFVGEGDPQWESVDELAKRFQAKCAQEKQQEGQQMGSGFNCRFHPTNWWHEVGCEHQEWTKEQLVSALKMAKKSLWANVLCSNGTSKKQEESV